MSVASRMEAKLRDYRALRRLREQTKTSDSTEDPTNNTNTVQNIDKPKKNLFYYIIPKIIRIMFTDKKKEDEIILMEPDNEPGDYYDDDAVDIDEDNEAESPPEEKEESWKYCLTKWAIHCIIWTSLFFYFVSIKFGAVYFTISVLLIIYFNTRTRPKKKGEVSAYSVFNRNCESIDGTLRAEQLQQQMMFGGVGGLLNTL